jgi:hypothetical protein
MPEYVERALARFGHTIPDKPQHQPHLHTIPTYGATIQYAKPEDTSRKLSPQEKKFIQEVIRVFLYYRRAVDSTMFTALSAIASAQAEPTEETMERCKLFLDYAATHQDAIITYHASDMVLVVHSDASYLSEPKARSRAGRHFFLLSDVATHSIMARYSTWHNSSKQSRHLLQKPSSVHCTSTRVRPSHSVNASRKWATSNHPPRCKPTTPQH